MANVITTNFDANTPIGSVLARAGLDWTVSMKDLVLAEDTRTCDSLEECRAVPVRAIVRSDNGAVLGVGGPDYFPVQNWEKLAVIAPLAESGVARMDTAGSLRGGRKVWLQADLGVEGDVLRGDHVRQRLLVAGSHDGSIAVRIVQTYIRAVCENTMHAALEQGTGVSIKHTRTASDRMAEVARVVGEAQRDFSNALQQWRGLARVSVTEARMREYIKSVFSQRKAAPVQAPASGIVVEDRTGGANGERVTERVMELVDAGAGVNIPGVRGTLWGTYNAVTEYLTHIRGNDADTRMDSLWFGNGAALNQRALDLALDMAR